MRRTFIVVMMLVAAVAGWAYLYPSAAILTAIKVRSVIDSTQVAPPREIAWQEGPQTAALGPVDRPPNIVLIVADDLGYNDISTFGGGVADGRLQTPHIDTLAAQGAVFTQSYSGSSTCAPSRAMLMTGRYSTRTGFAFTPMPPGMGRAVTTVSNSMDRSVPAAIYDAQAAANKPPYELQGLPAEEVTLAEALKSRGYHTAHIGKWHLRRTLGMAAHQQGFDESLLMASGLYLPEDHPDVVNAKLDFDPIDRFLWSALTFANSYNSGDADRFEPGGYLTDYWTDESIKVIKANRHRPFFLYLAHWGIHTPLQATRADYKAVGAIQPHRLRVYAAMTRALDRSVGRVMAALEEEGLSDNTIVIFTSDNGGANYIGMPDINKPYRGWKLSFFEGGTHIPYVMRWPQGLPSDDTYPHAVSHLDIMPTALGAAGLTPQAELLDGVNLLPYLTGRKAGRPHETLIWREGHYQAIMSGGWKMQRSMAPKKIRLFNMAKDPLEQNEVSAQNPNKVDELMAMLDAHNKQQADPLWPSRVSVPIWIDKTPAERLSLDDDYIYWPN